MGPYPKYIDFWKLTAKHNKNCDFYIVTDQTEKQYCDKNIHFLPMSFQELKLKLKNLLQQDFEDLTYNNLKKLCDIRITFGELFEEIVTKYEWYGWCEFDSFLGDFNFYLNDMVFEKYDFISYFGNNKVIYGPLVMINSKHKSIYRQIANYSDLITKNGKLFNKTISDDKVNPRWGENLTEEIHYSKVIADNNLKVYELLNGVPLIRQGNPRNPFTWNNGKLTVKQADKTKK